MRTLLAMLVLAVAAPAIATDQPTAFGPLLDDDGNDDARLRSDSAVEPVPPGHAPLLQPES